MLASPITPISEEENLGMSNAKDKLNAASIRGIVLVAGVIALLLKSWSVFWLLVAILLATSAMAGDIRFKTPRR